MREKAGLEELEVRGEKHKSRKKSCDQSGIATLESKVNRAVKTVYSYAL